ncbi:MAG: tetratricopeptide repeat protein, partial [Acidobacteriota bacterium]
LLLEKEGRPADALEVLRRSLDRRPSWRLFYDLASMEYRQGQLSAARRSLERLLDLAPNHFDASSFLAQLELQVGSPRRAVELYKQLVARSPGEAEVSNLSLAHLLLGEWEAAAESFSRVVDMSPSHPFYALNLADVWMLMGRREEATVLYRRVLELLAADASGGGWQYASVEAQAFAHLGRRQEAVIAIQRALRLAPDNLQVAYEASLVYTLVGETTSAVVHAERAIEELDRRWYSLPWFDDLRRDPRFLSLLDRPAPQGGPSQEAPRSGV